jgi:dolichyl-phosphate-mannose-protein mannosyltransferase
MISHASGSIIDVTPAERDVRVWWNLAAAALLIRFVIMPYGGFPVDIGTFKAWANSLAERGPAAFYGAGFADYLPGYLYVLWVIGEIHKVVRFNDPAFLFALKLPAALADVATAWIIFTMGRRFGAPGALALSASYLFNPGILFNSAFWGQADAVGALVVLAGIALLDVASPVVVAILLAAGSLIKPQSAPAVIPAALYLIRTLSRPPSGPPRWDVLMGTALAALATLVMIILPFGLSPIRLLGVLRTSLGVYPYSSVVAFNFWGATQGFWQSDGVRWFGVPLYALGTAATLVAIAAIAVWSWRHPTVRCVVLASAASVLVTFVLPTRIHERYLLTAIPFFAIASAIDRRMIAVYVGLTLVFTTNLVFAYTRPYVQTFSVPGWLEATLYSVVGTRTLSALGVAVLVVALVLLFRSATRQAAPVETAVRATTGD